MGRIKRKFDGIIGAVQIPAAMFIESAIDMLPKEDPKWTEDKKRELHEANYNDSLSTDFVRGYLLGVKTVEVMAALQGKEI